MKNMWGIIPFGMALHKITETKTALCNNKLKINTSGIPESEIEKESWKCKRCVKKLRKT
jgi:hypothetical protein